MVKRELDDDIAIVIDETFFDPYALKADQICEIQKLAKIIKDLKKCTYTQAAICAYIEWLGRVAECDIESIN